MNEREFAERNIRLSFEFSKYILDHPELEEQIPEGAEVVILLENDPEFNKEAMQLAEKSREEGQQVIFIRTKGLAHVPASRLINPEIVTV